MNTNWIPFIHGQITTCNLISPPTLTPRAFMAVQFPSDISFLRLREYVRNANRYQIEQPQSRTVNRDELHHALLYKDKE